MSSDDIWLDLEVEDGCLEERKLKVEKYGKVEVEVEGDTVELVEEENNNQNRIGIDRKYRRKFEDWGFDRDGMKRRWGMEIRKLGEDVVRQTANFKAEISLLIWKSESRSIKIFETDNGTHDVDEELKRELKLNFWDWLLLEKLRWDDAATEDLL